MPNTDDWTQEELKEYVDSTITVTIPVNMQIEGKQRVLNFSEVEKILREAKLISLGDCYCRKKRKMCGNPIDVCLSLDEEAEIQISKGHSRKVNLNAALDALKRSHKSGLVHLTFTTKGKEKPKYICSCCSCCCHSLSALIRFGMSEAVATSNHIAVDNRETCISCGTCVERCQFKARRLENGEVIFDPEKCFGCGVCVSTCPTKSISLAKRDEQPI